MKKVFLCTIVCISSLMAVAQNKFSVGPAAGFGWTSMSNYPDTKFKVAGSFGLTAVYSAVENFGIGMDLKYSFEGAKFGPGTTNNSIDLNYVRIPLKAIYFFNKYGSKVRPKIYAGPSFGILSSAKYNDADIKSSVENFDIGVLLGAGLNIKMVEKTWFNLDLGYTHGLKNVVKDDPLVTTNYKNRNLQLNVGVTFGL